MSVVIVFPDGSDWYVNGWEFHRLRERCEVWFPDDTPMRDDLARTHAYGGIALGGNEPGSPSILASLQKMAERTIAELTHGTSPLVPQDPHGQRGALCFYSDLLERIKRARATETQGASGSD